MPDHADQHFVPNSYLKAWCDPDVAPEHTPYVWRFSKDGTEARKKAPKNIFTETDLYTITAADGSRDLTLEHGLSQLETDFCIIREKVLAGTILTADEHTSLCFFTAAMQARTKAQRNHQARQWGEVYEMMKSMKEQFKSASPLERQQLERLSPPPPPGPENAVDFYNRLTRHHADEFFITNCNEAKPFWFIEEPLPEYAWERQQQE